MSQPDKARPIAWEDGGLNELSGLGRTIFDVLVRPHRTFRAFSRGSLGRALLFALIVHMFASQVFIAVTGRVDYFELLKSSSSFATRGLLRILLFGISFHAGAWLFGGKGKLGDSIRVLAYASTIVIVTTACEPLFAEHLAMSVAVDSIGLLFLGFAFSVAAGPLHGLHGTKAILAGLIPTLFLSLVILLLSTMLPRVSS